MEIATYGTPAQINIPLEPTTEQLSRHFLVVGATGSGKSNLVEKIVLDRIEKREAVIFLDPHGTSAVRILERIPTDRYQDVCYFDAADDTPVGFNPLANVPYDQQFLVAANLTKALRHVFEESWGERLNWFTLRSIHLAIERNRTFADVPRIFANAAFRQKLVADIKDPSLRQFWLEEYAGHEKRYVDDAKGPLFNKLGLFAASPHIRAIMMQERPMLDLERVMDSGRILIVNLNKGKIGAEQASILGSMLVSMINHYAMQRSEDAPRCNLVIDEFKNFGSSIFADMLSEVRKYNLSLVLVAQFLDQLREPVRNALIANVGSLVCFRVSPTDAQVISPALEVRADTLAQQHPFNAWARLSPDITAFALTAKPPTAPLARATTLTEQSRRHYGRKLSRHTSPSRPPRTAKIRRVFKRKP